MRSANDKGIRLRVILAMLCGLVFGHAADAYGVSKATLTCPPEIHSEQRAKTSAPGWKPWVDTTNSRHRLKSVQFYDGHPQELANLMPDNADVEASEATLVWTFPPLPPERRIWIACNYSETALKLIRDLPAGTLKCRVSHKGGEVRSIQCEQGVARRKYDY